MSTVGIETVSSFSNIVKMIYVATYVVSVLNLVSYTLGPHVVPRNIKL